MLWTVAAARLLLPADVHLQAPPNLADDFGRAARRRHRRLGRRLAGHPRPRQPRAALAGARPAAGGHRGRRATSSPPGSRSTPSTSSTPERWLHPACASRCWTAADAEGLGRDRRPAGTRAADAARSSPPARDAGRAGGRSPRCWPAWCPARRSASTRSSPCSAPGAGRWRPWPRWPTTCAAARWATSSPSSRNRNINYTNVCTFKCKFCAFSKGPLSLNLRGDPYLLDARGDPAPGGRGGRLRAPPRSACRAASIPSFDGDYYIDVTRAVKAVAPGIHVHGFTALEVTEGASGSASRWSTTCAA